MNRPVYRIVNGYEVEEFFDPEEEKRRWLEEKAIDDARVAQPAKPAYVDPDGEHAPSDTIQRWETERMAEW